MAKVVAWTDADWQRELPTRRERAEAYRSTIEPQWRENGNIVGRAIPRASDLMNISFTNAIELEAGEVDQGDSEIGINHAFRFIRFWHSQLSANPPSVIVRPRSTDPSDRRKADAADRISRFLRQVHEVEEAVDQMNLSMLITGTGYVKGWWNKDAGEIQDFDKSTKEVKMEGAHDVYSPATDDVWLDPDARRKSDIRWTIERIRMPLEEAIFKFGDHATKIKESVTKQTSSMADAILEASGGVQVDGSTVEIFEYVEKGMPVNGMAGRHAFFLADNTILAKGENKHYKARTPIKILTYLDVPNRVYGASVVEYVSRIQDMLTRLDSSVLDNIQAHGVVRMAIHESSEIEDEAISDSAWDYIKYGGSMPPTFVNPPQLMPDIWRFRAELVQAIQDLYGVNDSMLGIQRREQSAVSQQTSIESGTMVQRRLFKKYSATVQELYQDLLGLAQEHWDTPRQVQVLGEEKAFEVAEFSGADIANGFDLVVEYGTSLPLDPNMAREQLMLLMPALKEAGLSMKQILRRFKLNEVESALDRMELAADRQREIFEEMIAKAEAGEPIYIAPRKISEHEGMLEFAYDYIMTSEFKYLQEDMKKLIERHIEEREALAAQGAAPAEAGPGVQTLPGSPGVSGALPPEVGAMLPP